MAGMSNLLDLDDALPHLDAVLARRGWDISRGEFLSALEDAAETTETLTADEAAFAVDAGITADVLEPEAAARAQVSVGMSQAIAAVRTIRAGFTTTQVAVLLGIAPANVRRLAGRGDLYAAGRARGGETVFPAWQFVDGRVIPGLRGVLAAFPDDFHPLDIEQVMTSPLDELNGRTPVQWLSSDGPAAPVAEVVESLELT